MNLYGFAGGDPVNFADPFGLRPRPGEIIAHLAVGLATYLNPMPFVDKLAKNHPAVREAIKDLSDVELELESGSEKAIARIGKLGGKANEPVWSGTKRAPATVAGEVTEEAAAKSVIGGILRDALGLGAALLISSEANSRCGSMPNCGRATPSTPKSKDK